MWPVCSSSTKSSFLSSPSPLLPQTPRHSTSRGTHKNKRKHKHKHKPQASRHHHHHHQGTATTLASFFPSSLFLSHPIPHDTGSLAAQNIDDCYPLHPHLASPRSAFLQLAISRPRRRTRPSFPPEPRIHDSLSFVHRPPPPTSSHNLDTGSPQNLFEHTAVNRTNINSPCLLPALMLPCRSACSPSRKPSSVSIAAARTCDPPSRSAHTNQLFIVAWFAGYV